MLPARSVGGEGQHSFNTQLDRPHTPASSITIDSKEMPPMGGAGMNNGPAMMFVDLLPHKAPDGVAWKPKDIDLLNRRWTQVRGLVSNCVVRMAGRGNPS